MTNKIYLDECNEENGEESLISDPEKQKFLIFFKIFIGETPEEPCLFVFVSDKKETTAVYQIHLKELFKSWAEEIIRTFGVTSFPHLPGIINTVFSNGIVDLLKKVNLTAFMLDDLPENVKGEIEKKLDEHSVNKKSTLH